jgi:hypothetical protein
VPDSRPGQGISEPGIPVSGPSSRERPCWGYAVLSSFFTSRILVRYCSGQRQFFGCVVASVTVLDFFVLF